jgi:lipoprotein-releasing system ATP-binding protein
MRHYPAQLSGGQQQRVAVARALAGSPSILLADEPTGNLDFRTAGMVFDLLEELHRSHGLTSVFVTHNLAFARRCNRVLSMENGGISEG